MAYLAIQGHATRGNEVIALLKMLGGIDSGFFSGNETDRFYYIEVDKGICFIDYVVECLDFRKLTLEEFLEKFPYRVGDEVIAYVEGSLAHFTIQDVRWNDKLNKIEYKICSSWCDTSLMQPYKEETMKTITIDDFKANTKEWLIDKLHGMIISDAVKTIGNIHDELHKPKYPKTYEECCGVLGMRSDWHLTLELDTPATHDLSVTKEFDYVAKLELLRKLYICRNAYWKIAGAQMGLGKPWEPDWLNNEQDKYVLFTHNNAICCNRYVLGYNMLAFPTEEMRDAFYENFKDLIEQCKELL